MQPAIRRFLTPALALVVAGAVLHAGCAGDDGACGPNLRGGMCPCGGTERCVGGHWECPPSAGVAGCCGGAGPMFQCVAGKPGGACGDALVPAQCTGNGWSCPAGTIPTTSCACIGKPASGCVCGDGGWACSDGGTDAGDGGADGTDARDGSGDSPADAPTGG